MKRSSRKDRPEGRRFPTLSTFFIFVTALLTLVTVVTGIIAMPSLTGAFRALAERQAQSPPSGISRFFLDYFHYIWYVLSGVVLAMTAWGITFYFRSSLDYPKRMFAAQVAFFASFLLLVISFLFFFIFANLPVID